MHRIINEMCELLIIYRHILTFLDVLLATCLCIMQITLSDIKYAIQAECKFFYLVIKTDKLVNHAFFVTNHLEKRLKTFHRFVPDTRHNPKFNAHCVTYNS